MKQIFFEKNLRNIEKGRMRAEIDTRKKSLCTGAEWSKRVNLAFFGKLDLGGTNE